MNSLRIAFICAMLLTIWACRNTNQTNPGGQDTATKEQQSATFSDNLVYPIDSQMTVKVLTTGLFHSDEVWPTATKERWFGLFRSKGSFYVNETSLTVKRIHDVVVDEDDQETGWQVTTNNADTSIILMGSVSLLTNRKVEPVRLPQDIIYPGDTMAFNYKGMSYRLFATGNKKQDDKTGEVFEVTDYKLFIATTKEGLEVTQLLVAQPSFEDNMIDIIFAGDIDGDGILDMVIDIASHYNNTIPTLYLSKPAYNKRLLKPVGMHSAVGC